MLEVRRYCLVLYELYVIHGGRYCVVLYELYVVHGGRYCVVLYILYVVHTRLEYMYKHTRALAGAP